MSWTNSVPAAFGSGPRKSIKKIPGKLVVRILPPLHSCAVPGPNAGKWAILHKQHFGYDTPKGEGGKERNWNTFYCVEEYDWRSKTVTHRCPEDDNIKEHKDLYEATKKSLEREGKSKDELKRYLEPLENWKQKHNLDAKWYINVKGSEGDYYTLKLGTKLKKQLDTLIKELREPTQAGRKPIDAFDPSEGVWLEFNKSGEGFNTEYSVRVATETKEVAIDGVMTPVETIRKAPLAQNEKELAEATCYDLADVGIRRLSTAQVEALVKCDGSPDAIDAIFGDGQPVVAEPVVTKGFTTPTAPAGPFVRPDAVPDFKPIPEVVKAVVAPVAPVVDDEEAALMAQLEAARARKAAAALVSQVGNAAPAAKAAAILTQPEPGPKPVVKSALPDLANMSLEQLAAQFAPK